MPEHEPESMELHHMEPGPIGALPSGVRDRLRGRRRARRAQMAGGVLGVVAVAAVFVVVTQPSPTTPTPGPGPDRPEIATNGPDLVPAVVDEVEPLRLDDPMFASLDSGVEPSPPEVRWSIGSYLRGELPTGL